MGDQAVPQPPTAEDLPARLRHNAELLDIIAGNIDLQFTRAGGPSAQGARRVAETCHDAADAIESLWACRVALGEARTRIEELEAANQQMAAVAYARSEDASDAAHRLGVARQRIATLEAQRDVVLNVAKNLRNLGEVHEVGDDPVFEAILTDEGVEADVPMSRLFITAADVLMAALGGDDREQENDVRD